MRTDHIDLSQFTCALPKTEVSGLARHVRFTLRSRYRQPAPACPFGAKTGSRARLLDHFVGQREQLRWNFKSECLGGLEVYNEFEFC
jgi:hypothetical protein